VEVQAGGALPGGKGQRHGRQQLAGQGGGHLRPGRGQGLLRGLLLGGLGIGFGLGWLWAFGWMDGWVDELIDCGRPRARMDAWT
jgi:hypothetical protein